MDETPKRRGGEVAEFDADGAAGTENVVSSLAGAFSWERCIRCLMLCAVIFAVGRLAWRPSLLRLSQLMFMVAPSHGDSLAWKPERDDVPAHNGSRRRAPEPDEWRLVLDSHGKWRDERPDLLVRPIWRGSGLLPSRWKRLSGNPWNWRDDSGIESRRSEPGQPAQKPATAFRTHPADSLDGESDKENVANAASPAQETGEIAANLTAPAATAPGILPPGALQPPQAALSLPPDTPERQSISSAAPETQSVVAPPVNAAQKAVAGETDTSSLPVVSDASASDDWKNKEITAPIPGAYLTIYPKLKFIGLCVPGQGYVRKYNQIAVPLDSAGGKRAAGDGRTPYGRYYIAGRGRGEQGGRLELSWPSPDDARRIGLDSAQTAAVEKAWLGQSLPPQGTSAGGGLAIAELRAGQETTDGGFALETPHMEEIYTALPDGAWVFIQE